MSDVIFFFFFLRAKPMIRLWDIFPWYTNDVTDDNSGQVRVKVDVKIDVISLALSLEHWGFCLK